MPFTPAHPAIVLPLLRSGYLSATGLIVGSIVPDFEYFIRMNDTSVHGHTLAGVFYFDLPVACLIAFIFHRFVKINLINNLPFFFQRKFNDLKQFKFEEYFRKHWGIFLISILIGSSSHLFWDSFTHANRFFVRNISYYNEVIVPFDGARYPLYYALQLLSSWIGLTIVSLYILALKPDEQTQPVKPKLLYWLVLIVVTLLVLFFRFYWLADAFNFVRGVICSISGFCIALFIAGQIRFDNAIKLSNPH
jgi:Domain of unknown function (DUF4184)